MPAHQKTRHENKSASDRRPRREQGQRNREPERPTTQRDADDTAEQTLRARARHLAQPPLEATGGTEAQVLVFRLRDEQYAVEVGHLRSVQHGKDLTSIPCAPSFVAGILNVHGDVVAVLDLAAALDLTGAPAPAADRQVLLAACSQGRVGLLVDEVLGMHRLALDQLDRPLSGRDFATGIAGARTIFLNLEQLLSGGRFDVSEDVS